MFDVFFQFLYQYFLKKKSPREKDTIDSKDSKNHSAFTKRIRPNFFGTKYAASPVGDQTNGVGRPPATRVRKKLTIISPAKFISLIPNDVNGSVTFTIHRVSSFTMSHFTLDSHDKSGATGRVCIPSITVPSVLMII